MRRFSHWRAVDGNGDTAAESASQAFARCVPDDPKLDGASAEVADWASCKDPIET